MKMIDPPSGWRFGFPKQLTLQEGQSIEEWLGENGYPREEIDRFPKGRLPVWIWERSPLPATATRIDSHAVGERAKILLVRRFAAALHNDPMLRATVKAHLDQKAIGETASFIDRLWRKLLHQPLDEVLSMMAEDSQRGRMLRSTNPFRSIMPVESEGVRRQIWRDAKAQLHTEQVTEAESSTSL